MKNAWVSGLWASMFATSVLAQTNAPSTVAGSPPGFNYPMTMEAVSAAPANHHVLYEDDHVRLLEVTVWPGVRERMHGHAYPSVFAFQAIQPKMINDHVSGGGPPLFGASTKAAGTPEFPVCMTLGPQTPHAALVTESYPQHFFRLEFKRLDGASGFADNWKRWYADVGRDRVLMANDQVRLVEVMIMPGATESEPASSFSSVRAYDTPEPGAAAMVREEQPAGPMSTSRAYQHAGSPPSWPFPTCDARGPVEAHQTTNTGVLPIHYYRIEFPRIDGEGFRINWRRDYPEIARGQPEMRAGGVDAAWVGISDALEQAWNQKDGAAWGRAFWPDAVAVNNSGGLNHGGESMGARHAVVFAGRQKGTTMRSTIVETQRLSENAAILGTIEEVAPAPGSEMEAIQVFATLVVERRQGIWKIRHMQITTIASPGERRARAAG